MKYNDNVAVNSHCVALTGDLNAFQCLQQISVHVVTDLSKKTILMIMSKPHKTGLAVTKSEHRQEEPIDSSDDKRVVRPFVLG